MRTLKRAAIKSIKLANYLGSGISIRLVKWTGKAPQLLHPKHLIKDNAEFAEFFDADDVVLDIGCANGQRDFKLASKVKKIVAFDYDDRLLAQAKEWQAANKVENVEFSKISAEERLPFEDWSFDKILFLDVLEHLNNRELALSECYRLLKPGGRMIIAVPNSDTSWKRLQKSAGLPYYSDSDHKIEYTKEEIIDVLTKARFKILRFDPIVLDFCLAGLIDLVGGFSLSLYKKMADWKKKKAREDESESVGFMILAEK
ncbi:class I SAM-dependent methyltransferase [Candidatus Falkowbacteria bacterium]|nr:class I SAM-dependent methyltransferase [Candidatus Falkowbacteria bacterium]